MDNKTNISTQPTNTILSNSMISFQYRFNIILISFQYHFNVISIHFKSYQYHFNFISFQPSFDLILILNTMFGFSTSVIQNTKSKCLLEETEEIQVEDALLSHLSRYIKTVEEMLLIISLLICRLLQNDPNAIPLDSEEIQERRISR